MSQNNSIYIANLSFKLSEEDLKKHFSQFGHIEDVRIPTDRDTGKPRGFAFVTFDSNEAASNALSLNGKELDGRTLRVDVAQKKGK